MRPMILNIEVLTDLIDRISDKLTALDRHIEENQSIPEQEWRVLEQKILDIQGVINLLNEEIY